MTTFEHNPEPGVPAEVPATIPAEGSGGLGLRPKQEQFAQLYAEHGNATRAYREVFEVSTDTTHHGRLRQRAYELVHTPAVAERVRQILAVAAEATTINARARMVGLQAIIEADPGEVARVVTEPCRSCWPDAALAAAIQHAIDHDTEWPNQGAPQPDCELCRGHGQQRVVVTDTDKLSPAARHAVRSVRQKANGEIEVRLHDKLAAADMLNKMQGAYVERSVSLNVHAHVEPLRDMTPAEIADLIQQQRAPR